MFSVLSTLVKVDKPSLTTALIVSVAVLIVAVSVLIVVVEVVVVGVVS